MNDEISDENTTVPVGSGVIEHKRMDQHLGESEQKFRCLVEDAAVAICVIDLKGRFTYVNNAAVRLLGYSVQELLGHAFKDFLHPDDRGRMVRLFIKAFGLLRQPPNMEFRAVSKDGSVLHLMTKPTKLKINGKTVGFQAIIVDVTEQKKAEKVIRENQQKFERLFKGIPEAAVYWDPNFRVLGINPRFTELFGFSLGEIRGKNPISFLVPKDRIGESNTWGRKAREGYVNHDTIRKRKDGTLVSVSISVAPMIVEDQLIGYVGLYKDITERRKAEEALLAERDRLETVTKNVGAGLAIISRDYRTVWANEVLKQLFGNVEDTICYTTYNQRDAICPRCGVREVFETGKVKVVHEQAGKDVDGKTIWSEIIATPIKDKSGNITAALELVVPITERKKAEQALHESEERYRSLFENAKDIVLTTGLEGNVTSINKAIEEYGWKREGIVGKNMLELMSKESWPSLLKGIDQIAEGRPLEGEIELVTPIDKRIVEYKSSLIIQENKAVGVQVIARDITERKLMETRLSTLNSFGGKLNAANSLDEVYELILDAMGKTLGFEYAAFSVIDRDKLRVACQRGYNKAIDGLPLDGTKGGIIAKAARSHKAVLVGDVRKEPDYVEGAPDIQSELAVPVIANNEVLGVLNVESMRLSAFDKKDVTLLEILGSHAAIAISNLRKRSEIEMALKRIIESEEKYRNLFENAQDTIVTINLEGKITSVNCAVQKYGYDRNEIVGESVFDLIPEEERLGRQHNILKLAQGKSTESEFKIKTKNKSGYAIVEARSNPILQDGSVVGIQTIMRDATERKEMAEKLRDSEERFRAITLSANAAIVLIDDEGKFSYWNPAAEKMFGYTEKEVNNTKMYELITPKRFHRDHINAFEKFTKIGKGRIIGKTVELPAIKKDGTEFPVEFSLSALQVKGKWYALGIFRDVTERKKMEEEIKQYSEHLEDLVQKRTEELLESEKRYSVLVEEASDGVIILQHKKLVFANKKAAEIVGYSRDELKGLPLEKLIDEKYLPVAKKMYERNLRGDVSTTFEVEWRAKNGERIPVEVSDARIRYQGHPAVLRIARDIRERKRLEEQRRKLEKMTTIGELATMVAHDLRNPLTSIRNASFYIKNACPNRGNVECKTVLEMFDVIEQETVFADSIINDLLDFAARRPPLRKSQNVNNLIENALRQIDMAENVKIERKFAKKAVASVDEKQLERVFLNLIKNSVQAMPNGGKLEVTTIETEDHIRTAFTDTGTGIAEENMSKIFTPLFTTKAKGIGMGLSICKKIVEEHGGTIDVESKVGQGTTFTITLPKDKGASDQ